MPAGVVANRADPLLTREPEGTSASVPESSSEVVGAPE